MHELDDLFLRESHEDYSPVLVVNGDERLNTPSSASLPLMSAGESADLNIDLLLDNVGDGEFSFFDLPDHNTEFHFGLDFEDATSETPSQLLAVDWTPQNVTIAAPDPSDDGSAAKSRARFSRESVQILKRWLLSHNQHPYPDEEEKAMLQRQTGLNKTQISNWLANARRRGKVQRPRPMLSHADRAWAEPIDVPRRPPTPAFESKMQNMNPLQRWVDSPPENEPASASAIATALASGGGSMSDPNSFAFADEVSSRSLCNGSSASSVGTTSGGSFASAYSHNSDGSWGSFGSTARINGRRRRRIRGTHRRHEKTSLITPLKPYQCTFCTETFKTKHVWQRHEKSLHLSLEKWICAHQGPRAVDPKTNQICCAFCAKVDPDDAHLESHNYITCNMRPLEEKTFYRKDHLNQHLRLVHDAKFLDWCMDTWKITTSEIRSRCGFCEIVMYSWPARIEHLADHFKSGKTMADWKGDWGFEPHILDMLKNSIPPYLVDMERSSTSPHIAGHPPFESPRTAYELIASELNYFIENYQEENGTLPSNPEMELEACRVILASEVLSREGISTECSWLRDLFMASEEVAKQAKFAPLRQGTENRHCILKINGKENLFEQCPLELQLNKFVHCKALLGHAVTDKELQEECCYIIGRIEDSSTAPSDFIANWVLRLVMSSTSWLAKFRQRTHLPESKDPVTLGTDKLGDKYSGLTIYDYSKLEKSLGEYIDTQRAKGIEPSDEDLKREARIIIYGVDEGWIQTSADNVGWLVAFKQRHGRGPTTMKRMASDGPQPPGHASDWFAPTLPIGGLPKNTRKFEGMMKNTFFLCDTNCYRRLAQDLTRFVTSTMSPRNPNRHVPTDAEIQHQARWIMFDNDDPWNQTAADNEEWLQRFKRDVGILPPGPGLGLSGGQPQLT